MGTLMSLFSGLPEAMPEAFAGGGEGAGGAGTPG